MAEWVFFELAGREVVPTANPLAQGHNVSQPPVLESREEVERFIGELRVVAERVFGSDRDA